MNTFNDLMELIPMIRIDGDTNISVNDCSTNFINVLKLTYESDDSVYVIVSKDERDVSINRYNEILYSYKIDESEKPQVIDGIMRDIISVLCNN